MRAAFYSVKGYDKTFFEQENNDHAHEMTFYKQRLTEDSVDLAAGHEAVCCFVNDRLDETILARLKQHGIGLVTLRSAGFDNIDLKAAERLGLAVKRVAAYSPRSIAEHAVALMLALNRHIHRAHDRVRNGNFSLEGLVGFGLYNKTVGIVGTGKIGQSTARILKGFGCRVLAHDVYPDPSLLDEGWISYLSLDELVRSSDIISLHCPLTPDTFHMINAPLIAKMKPGVMLINTSRGGLIDTQAILEALKSNQIGYLGIDVYEHEQGLFFEDLSNMVIQDDVLMRLTTFPNVLVTGHQAFLTEEALTQIAKTTLAHMTEFEAGKITS